MDNNSGKTCGTCGRIFSTQNDFLRMTSRWRVCSQEHLSLNCECGSTIFLKKGKYPWYSPDKALKQAGASKDAISIFQKLKAGKQLPYIKAKIMQMTEKLKEPDINLSTIVDSLKTEPLLAINIINMAEKMQMIEQGKITQIGGIMMRKKYRFSR